MTFVAKLRIVEVLFEEVSEDLQKIVPAKVSCYIVTVCMLFKLREMSCMIFLKSRKNNRIYV